MNITPPVHYKDTPSHQGYSKSPRSSQTIETQDRRASFFIRSWYPQWPIISLKCNKLGGTLFYYITSEVIQNGGWFAMCHLMLSMVSCCTPLCTLSPVLPFCSSPPLCCQVLRALCLLHYVKPIPSSPIVLPRSAQHLYTLGSHLGRHQHAQLLL